MHITLRAGEKLYLNGAVLRADRKVSIELMNDATFLLEAHVMSPEKATSPLRQLYFVVQMMLMDPSAAAMARAVYDAHVAAMLETYDDDLVLEALRMACRHVAEERFFDTLKLLRSLFKRDDDLMGLKPTTSVSRKAA